jgi:hypothetical protein
MRCSRIVYAGDTGERVVRAVAPAVPAGSCRDQEALAAVRVRMRD